MFAEPTPFPPTRFPKYQDMQELVTSSGTTEDFETYDFDQFTDFITIAGQTLSVAEVPTHRGRTG